MQTLKDDTRKRILSVSKRLFLKKGFRETTTRDIARETGINLSNLYHYFASKDELFRQLLKPATDTLDAMSNIVTTASLIARFFDVTEGALEWNI